MAITFGTTQAAERPVPGPSPVNHPPECTPIRFYQGGYWGMRCIDQDNNISSVTLETNVKPFLYWDSSHVEMVVKLQKDTTIYWLVCDKAGACVDGRYP